ncbi:actin cortical patch SUR7/pH-response regulator pali [Xylariales sp. PMI_506]|nr:actin cortical patch SUR7/pH-response regulator pali [Xylariales sp. PMI_506]
MAASKLTVVIPLILSIAGFALAMIALFAGSKPGQMEEFHIVAINMSNFGHDLVPTSTTTSQPTSTGSGIGSIFSSLLATAESTIENGLDDLEGDVADELSAALGISQWYSLHLTTACEGNFAPNATTPGATYNTTNCTAQRAGFQFNLTAALDHELDIGPLHLNTDELDLPQDLVDAVNYLNGFLLAIFILYCIGSGFSGLSFLACIAILTVARDVTGVTALINTALTGLAALALMIGSAISTGVAKKGASEINNYGEDVGISAIVGKNFLIISWVSFAVMFVASLYWLAVGITGRRVRTAGLTRGKSINSA